MNNNESRDFFRSIVFLAAFFAAFSFVFIFAISVDAASTIGTNILTTGTLEVQNTASASYFLTGNTIQVGGFASAAYNRFGTATTTHAGSITTTNDLLISGDFEVNASAAFDGKAYFGSTASIAGVLELADGEFRPQSDGATAFRFQNAAADTNVLVINTTNGWVGVGTTPQTKFEVQGTASASYFLTGNTIQVGGFASAAYNRFGTATTTHAGSITTTNDLLISGDLEVDASAAFDGKAYFGSTASIAGVLELANGQIRPQSDGTSAFKLQNAAATYSVLTVDSTNLMASVSRLITGGVASASLTAYSAQFNSAATSSVLFGTSSTNKGTCLQMKDTTGANVYVRINGTSFVINSISCR